MSGAPYASATTGSARSDVASPCSSLGYAPGAPAFGDHLAVRALDHVGVPVAGEQPGGMTTESALHAADTGAAEEDIRLPICFAVTVSYSGIVGQTCIALKASR